MFVCTGTYMLKNPLGRPCIKATMGVEYIVIEKKVWGCDWLSTVCGISALFADVCLCQCQFLRVTYVGLTVQTVNRKEKDDANSYPHT